MAKAIATCTCRKCGNTFQMIAYKNNRREADSYIAWAEQNCDVCKDCYKAAKQAEADRIDATLAPITEGSEKQIAWAKQIRAKTAQLFWSLRSLMESVSTNEKELALLDRFFEHTLNSHTARYWIDNRFYVDDQDFWLSQYDQYAHLAEGGI